MVASASRLLMASPLTKTRKRDNSLYTRPAEIEAAIDQLLATPRAEVLARLRIRSRKDPDHVPSEAIAHLIRATRSDNDHGYFDALYAELLRRIDRVLPRAEEGASDGRDGKNISREQVRDDVVDRFTEMLVEDLAQQADALDIFECRFDYAIAKLRSSAWRRLCAERDRRDTKTVDELSLAIENGDKEFLALRDKLFSDPTSRIRLHAMIDSLQDRDRRIMQMLIADFTIHSTKPDEVTISGVLGCDESTVRNRRDAFIKAMRSVGSAEDKS